MKINHLLKLSFLLTFIIFGTVACDKTTEDKPNPFDSYNKSELLNNVYDNSLQSWENLKTVNDSMKMAADVFNAAPSVDKLIEVQQKWKSLQKALKYVEFTRFLAEEMSVNYAALDYWPIRVQDVETLILASDSIPSSVLRTKGVIYKGIPVVEYMLFQNKELNSQVALYTDAQKGKVRKGYLKALIQEIDFEIKKQINFIEGNKSVFINGTSQDATGSINKIVNELVKEIEVIKNAKVGKPAGKKDGTLYPNQVEAVFSQHTNQSLINSLDAAELLMTGGSKRIGFYDMLTYFDASSGGVPLANQIKAQFTDCRAKVYALNDQLKPALEKNPAAADDLYLSLKKLIVLLKVEMSSQLGVVITFTDNDGD